MESDSIRTITEPQPRSTAHSSDASVRVVLSAVFGNSVITVAKFIGWALTQSPSMLAESIHSLADTTNQVLLFIGIRQSKSGPTREYPWGRSNARYLWNLVSALGVFFIGFGVTTYHGVSSLFTDEPYVANRHIWVTIIILLAAFVIEGYVFVIALKSVLKDKGDQSLVDYIRKGDNPTSVAVVLEDGVAVLGVVLALIGIVLSKIFQTSLPDSITAIIIGFLLGLMALILAFANGRLLIGVAAPPVEESEIRDYIENYPTVEKVTSLKTEVMGPDRLRLTAEIEFHGGILIDREQISKDAEKIREGEEDPLPILVDTAERMVRVMGKEINELEQKLYNEFPSLVVIDLEVN